MSTTAWDVHGALACFVVFFWFPVAKWDDAMRRRKASHSRGGRDHKKEKMARVASVYSLLLLRLGVGGSRSAPDHPEARRRRRAEVFRVELCVCGKQKISGD